jgi:hypothetical protein
VGKLKAAGYEDLAPTTLIELRQTGVEPKEEDGEDDHKPCAEKERHRGEEEE